MPDNGETGQDPASTGAGDGQGQGQGGNGAGDGQGGSQNPSGAPGGQQSNGGQDPAGDNAGAGTGAGKTYNEDYVKSLRAEAAKHRTELKATMDRLKALEDAQLTEEQRKAKELDELKAQNASLMQQARRGGILAAAARMNATVPEAIVGMVPADADDVDAAVAAIKKSFPQLFQARVAGSADAGAGTGQDAQKPKLTTNEIIRRAAGRS